jgi:hypothetical protein
MLKKYLNNQIGIEELVLYYDKNNYTEKEIKEGGVVYTPKHISDFIVNNLKPTKTETIFEPSVGHGIFLFSLLEYMEDKVSDLKKYFLNQVVAQDIQKNNIEELKDILIVFFKKRNIYLTKEEIINLKTGNTLENNDTYDIIFGNPPYIRIQNLVEQKEFLKKNFKSCEKGNIDIYYAFMEFALNHSKRSSYIVPNAWLKTKSATSLRKLVLPRLKKVIDFKEKKIFENVGTYTSIFFIDRKSENFVLEVYGKEYILNKNRDIIKLNTEVFKKIKIERFHTPIATLRDKIFIKESPDSIPFFKISKVKSEKDFFDAKQSIIFPYDEDFKIQDLSQETLTYLTDNKEELAKRDKGNKVYERWYAYGRRQGFSKYNFQNKVIIIPGMISLDYNFFEIDLSKINEPFLFTSGFLLEVSNSKKVLEFLNSEAFKKILKESGKIWPGNYYSLNISNLKELFYVV